MPRKRRAGSILRSYDHQSDLDERIARARKHVESGRRVVEQQRMRIATGVGKGLCAEARMLLQAFEQSLQILEDDLVRLLHEKAKLTVGLPTKVRGQDRQDREC